MPFSPIRHGAVLVGSLVMVSAGLLVVACSGNDDGESQGQGQGPGSSSGGRNGSSGGTSSTVVPDEVAAGYVDAHNAVRAAVVEPDNYGGVWEPIPPVGWSDTVAATAQAWAEHLRDTEDCNLVHDGDSGYGENLAASTRGLTPADAVEMWASEGGEYSYDANYSFDSNTGHYTQIVWRETAEIGCGSASCDGGWTVVCCRYSPPGNWIGQRPF